MISNARADRGAAKIDLTRYGIGVSITARKHYRTYFKGISGVDDQPNDLVNEVIATDFKKASPLHRFVMDSNEVGEIRQSDSFFYLGVYRFDLKRYDVIAIQPNWLQVPPDVVKKRLTQEWIDSVQQGKVKPGRRT